MFGKKGGASHEGEIVNLRYGSSVACDAWRVRWQMLVVYTIETIDYSASLPTVHATPLPPSAPVPSSPVKVNSNVDYFLLLGRQPAIMPQCPKCSTKNIRTHVRTYPSILSWLMAIGMFVMCWPLRFVPMWLIPIAFLPLLYDKVSKIHKNISEPFAPRFTSLETSLFYLFNCTQLKRSDHYCSTCSQRVGTVAPLSDCGSKTLI